MRSKYTCKLCGGSNIEAEFHTITNPNQSKEKLDEILLQAYVDTSTTHYCKDCESDVWLDETFVLAKGEQLAV